MGPWVPFCLYLAARVLVQLLAEPKIHDSQKHVESLEFMMALLKSFKQTSSYTVSLILQLEADIAASSKLNPLGHIVVPMDTITEVR